MAPYYQGLPSHYNFYYWYTLKDRINQGRGNDFAKTVRYFRGLFRQNRPGFIDAIKLTNHDEDRAASDLRRDINKEKLAAAVLLTSPGKPFVYQGEELGYWGTKSRGDEYIRTPIKWSRSGNVPAAALGGKVDDAMLNAEISVEAQSADPASLLSVYRDFATARNTYKALAHGEMEAINTSSSAMAAWTMSCDGQTLLIFHNFSSYKAAEPVGTKDLSHCIALNGSASLKTTSKGDVVSNRILTLDPYSSAIFLLNE
jgi:glycosidase